MFNLFKKKQQFFDGDLSILNCDMHSHLIPGIDDGSPDVETSIQLIEGLQEAGYKKLITTPHLMADLYPNTRQTIERGFDKLKSALLKKNNNIEIRAAAEYFLDDHFDSLLQSKEPLLTIKDNLVLVEFSFASAPFDYKEKLFNLQMKGYRPILAHPERYAYFHKKPEIYEELRNAGCLFQVNILSLDGYYGRSVAQMAERLFKSGFIEFLGTDLHHQKHLDHLRTPEVYEKINEIAGTLSLMNTQL